MSWLWTRCSFIRIFVAHVFLFNFYVLLLCKPHKPTISIENLILIVNRLTIEVNGYARADQWKCSFAANLFHFSVQWILSCYSSWVSIFFLALSCSPSFVKYRYRFQAVCGYFFLLFIFALNFFFFFFISPYLLIWAAINS